MSENRGASVPFLSIDWTNPDAIAIDGFTVAEIEVFIMDSVVEARCTSCDEITAVEPDARSYDCEWCEAKGSVTSPLVKLGLV